MALIYLDICCFNRPFDDQTQLLIQLQTEAKLAVQDAIRTGRHQLVMDALHLASAIQAGAHWFLTTDHALLRKGKREKRVKVVDPIDFIRLTEGFGDEDRC